VANIGWLMVIATHLIAFGLGVGVGGWGVMEIYIWKMRRR